MRPLRFVPENTAIDFVANRWPAFTFTGLLFLVTIVSLIWPGLNLGIDFRGGILIELNRLAEAREALTESLELEPGHPTALHELQVIEAAEAGQGIGEFEIIRPAAAEQATGD